MFFCIAYLHNRGKWPNLRHPRDLSEIWIAHLLSGKVHDNYLLADKYRVREYVEQRGLGNILTPLIAAYDRPEDIEWEQLPQQFAIKLNYGAGMNIICQDKSQLNPQQTVVQLHRWLDNHGKYSFSESHYNLIERKIVVEEFIDDGNGGFPTDYKFMVLRGKVACILAVYGREDGHGEYLPYTVNWKPREDYAKTKGITAIPCPANLGEMISIAERLAKGLDLVRVDLYSNGQRIWFGEMTLTPAGCIFHNWTQKALDEMGKQYRGKTT